MNLKINSKRLSFFDSLISHNLFLRTRLFLASILTFLSSKFYFFKFIELIGQVRGILGFLSVTYILLSLFSLKYKQLHTKDFTFEDEVNTSPIEEILSLNKKLKNFSLFNIFSYLIKFSRKASLLTNYSTFFIIEITLSFLYDKASSSKANRESLSRFKRNVSSLVILTQLVTLPMPLFLKKQFDKPIQSENLPVDVSNNAESLNNPERFYLDKRLLLFCSLLKKLILQLLLHDSIRTSSYGYFNLFLETSVTFLEDFINSNYSLKELVELYSGRLIPNNQQNEDIISKKVNPTNYVVVLYLFSIIIFNILPTIILTKVLLTTNHYVLKVGSRVKSYTTLPTSLNHSFIFRGSIFITQKVIGVLSRLTKSNYEKPLLTSSTKITTFLKEPCNKLFLNLEKVGLSLNGNEEITIDCQALVTASIIKKICSFFVTLIIFKLFFKQYLEIYYWLTSGKHLPVEIEYLFKEFEEFEASRICLRGFNERSEIIPILKAPLFKEAQKITTCKALAGLLSNKDSYTDSFYTRSLLIRNFLKS